MININYSAEMMTNYLHAEIISPQDKFEALQTINGHSLLFSIGTDRVFYLIREESGKTAAGWSKIDLSSSTIQKEFAVQSNAHCRTFEVGQSVQDGSLGMAMVVSTSNGDYLYLCLSNSHEELGWANSPKWVSYPCDDPQMKPLKLEIVNVFFSETTDNQQYIIVDVARDPSNTVKHIRRFYIDPQKQSGRFWNSHDLPIDIEIDRYDSCLGRAKNSSVDGIYTIGHVEKSGQMEFCPIVNEFGDTAPSPVRLNLPESKIPSAITATRNSDLTSDLFAVSGSTLYYFSNSNQDDEAIAATVFTNDVLCNTSKLIAMSHDGTITLWGLNASDQVYYTTCLQSNILDASAWSVPLPILSGIEKISPYINQIDGGNTIFAAGGGRLQRIVQDPHSTLWQTHEITLPVLPQVKAISFNSYTTTILVSNSQNVPLTDEPLILIASTRCAVYVNGLYYTIDNKPVQIKSDSLGSVTIVEVTGTLSSTTFIVLSAREIVSFVVINPMDTPFKKLASLNTPEQLKAAQIQQGDGKTRPLIDPKAPHNNVQAVASALSNLSKSYDQHNVQAAVVAALSNLSKSHDQHNVQAVAAALNNLSKSHDQHTASEPRASALATNPVSAPDLEHHISVTIGDLLSWLRTGITAIVDVIEDEVKAAYRIVAEVAGKVYSALLDTVDAVVEAAQWVFNAVKTKIEDIIKFVEFLFEWDDIKRTKEVLHNLIKRYLESQVSSIETVKQDFDNLIHEAETKVNQWAGITDWSGLGETASQTARQNTVNPIQDHNSGSLLLAHHFQNNAQSISILGDVPPRNPVETLIQDLTAGLEKEKDVLNGACEQLYQLAKDFPELTVEQALKRLAGILANSLLGSVKFLADIVLDSLALAVAEVIKVLDIKIHIPVISDILNSIGIPDVSFLDLFCWIGGVAFTVVYKAVKRKVPFPDDEVTTFLKTATSFDQIRQALHRSTSRLTAPESFITTLAAKPMMSFVTTSVNVSTASSTSGGSDHSWQVDIFIAGHLLGGFFALYTSIINVYEMVAPDGNPIGTVSAVLGIVGAGFVQVARQISPKAPMQHPEIKAGSTAISGIRIGWKLLYAFHLQRKVREFELDGRIVGTAIDAFLFSIPQSICSIQHFLELSELRESYEKTDAVLDEVSDLISYLSRFTYLMAVSDPDPETKVVAIGAMTAISTIYSGLQMAQTFIV